MLPYLLLPILVLVATAHLASNATTTKPTTLKRSSGGHVDRRRQEALHLLVQLEERDGEARRLQRGHVVPDVGHAPDVDALLVQAVGDAGVGDVELHGGRAAHAVHHHGDLRVREVHGVAQDLVQHLVHYLVRGLYLLALGAGLAVDAHPDLHLVVPDLEDGLPRLRRYATR